MIFGDRVVSLALLCDLCALYPLVLVDLFFVVLGPTVVGLDGKSVGMGLLLGQGRLPRWLFLMSCWFSSGAPQFSSCIVEWDFAVAVSALLWWYGGEEVGIVRVEPCVQVGLDDRAGAHPSHDGWWEVEKSPAKQENSSTPCESRFFRLFDSSPCVEEIEGL